MYKPRIGSAISQNIQSVLLTFNQTSKNEEGSPVRSNKLANLTLSLNDRIAVNPGGYSNIFCHFHCAKNSSSKLARIKPSQAFLLSSERVKL